MLYKTVSKPKENLPNATNMHHTGASTLEMCKYPSVERITQREK